MAIGQTLRKLQPFVLVVDILAYAVLRVKQQSLDFDKNQPNKQ